MRLFTANEINKIWKDILLFPVADNFIIDSISTDSRRIVKNDSFVAIKGEKFDGHNFIDSAIESGARNIVVEEKHDNVIVNQVVVTNTRLALAKLASAIRREFKGKVIGLTGSAGKTTSKQMLSSICSLSGKTHVTKGNLNNDLGVPFTWFDLPKDIDYVVIEMGANHQGEISYLTKITCPNIAMITNAGEAHLEGFGSLDGVAKAKGEIFSNLLKSNTAILNIDDKYKDYWMTLIKEGVSLYTFSLGNAKADVYATDISDTGSSFILCIKGEKHAVEIPTFGNHNVMNALGCAACAIALGIDASDIVKGLRGFNNVSSRLQYHKLRGVTLIDDTYNANPVSVRASSKILNKSKGFRLMILGDMKELGSNEKIIHSKLGEEIKEAADLFLCFGNNMKYFALANNKSKHFNKIEDIKNIIPEIIKDYSQATILVKGSYSMNMREVVDFLLKNIK